MYRKSYNIIEHNYDVVVVGVGADGPYRLFFDPVDPCASTTEFAVQRQPAKLTRRLVRDVELRLGEAGDGEAVGQLACGLGAGRRQGRLLGGRASQAPACASRYPIPFN